MKISLNTLLCLLFITGCSSTKEVTAYATLIGVIVSACAIIITTVIAIYTIKKNAETSKIANIHHELSVCLTELISIIDQILNLLHAVSYNTQYKRITDDKIIDTAYDQYWNRIDDLNNQFIKLHGKMLLLLPKDIFESFQGMLKKINEARYKVLAHKPLEDGSFSLPKSDRLRAAMEINKKEYFKLIKKCRNYIGSPKISRIVTDSEHLLGDQKSKID